MMFMRMEPGLYVCSSCKTAMNAYLNGAVNIRRSIMQSPPTGQISTGWLAQTGVFPLDYESKTFNRRK